MATAVADSQSDKKIFTVDLQEKFTREVERHLAKRKHSEHVLPHCSDATAFCQELISQGKQFIFAFVDHCHEYASTKEVCEIIHKLLEPGSFCLFQDFNNPKNADPDNRNVGVYQAVEDSLPKDVFEFYGIYGSTGLYRRD